MSARSPAEPSQRQLRVGEQLRHIIAETMQRGHFHEETLLDASNKVTVTEVRVSPDLKNATAFVVPLGGGEMGDMLKALNDEHQVFQKEINRQSSLKFTPRVKFKQDNSFDQAQRIETLLDEIHYSPDNPAEFDNSPNDGQET